MSDSTSSSSSETTSSSSSPAGNPISKGGARRGKKMPMMPRSRSMWAAGGSRKRRGGGQLPGGKYFAVSNPSFGYPSLPGGKQTPGLPHGGSRKRRGGQPDIPPGIMISAGNMIPPGFLQPMTGGNADPYSSAAGYGMYVNGTEPQQWDRVFTNDGSTTPYGNTSIGVQGQNSVLPASVNFSGKILQGGKRRGKKGGWCSGLTGQGVVPNDYQTRNPVVAEFNNNGCRPNRGGKRSRSKRGGYGYMLPPPNGHIPSGNPQNGYFGGKRSRSKRGGNEQGDNSDMRYM